VRSVIFRVDGTPSLGWDDTIAFLILPAFLVVSQYVSMELMQPKSTDPAQQQSNAILKVLPLMIGWFSLSVPAALSVYWVTNNIVTTASSLWIRNSMPKTAPKPASTGVATTSAPTQSIFTPLREKPAGFGDSSTRVSSAGSDGVKPITAMDAEILDEDEDYEDDDDEEEEGSPTPSSEPKKKRRKIKKKKRN
jgi:YidC/Oxa1 family membrane protein insertase